MIAEGTDVNTVREICGHKSLKTTMDYVRLLGGAVKRVAKIFGISPHPTGSIGSRFERLRLNSRPLISLVAGAGFETESAEKLDV